MKYLGKITDNKDLVTKEYVDSRVLPTVSASDNGNVLEVVNGSWNKSDDVDASIIKTTTQTSFGKWKHKTGPFGTTDLRRIRFLNNKYIVVGYGKAFYSTDGENWNEASGPFESLYYTDIAYGLDKYVIVGYAGRSLYSTDGETWYSMTGMSGYNINGVAFGNDRFICVGGNGASYYSTDGTSWTAMSTSLPSASFNGVAYGNSKFVCLGASGYCYYSSNGTTWTSVSGLDTSVQYNSIDYCNNRFICLGPSGKSYYSTTGTSWSICSGLPTVNFTAASYGNGKYVCVGTSGKSLYSTSGTAWNFTLSDLEIKSYQSLCFDGTKFLTVGYSGILAVLEESSEDRNGIIEYIDAENKLTIKIDSTGSSGYFSMDQTNRLRSDYKNYVILKVSTSSAYTYDVYVFKSAIQPSSPSGTTTLYFESINCSVSGNSATLGSNKITIYVYGSTTSNAYWSCSSNSPLTVYPMKYSTSTPSGTDWNLWCKYNRQVLISQSGSTSTSRYYGSSYVQINGVNYTSGTIEVSSGTYVYVYGKTGYYYDSSYYDEGKIMVGVKLNGAVVGSTSPSTAYTSYSQLYSYYFSRNGYIDVKLLYRHAVGYWDTLYVEITEK